MKKFLTLALAFMMSFSVMNISAQTVETEETVETKNKVSVVHSVGSPSGQRNQLRVEGEGINLTKVFAIVNEVKSELTIENQTEDQAATEKYYGLNIEIDALLKENLSKEKLEEYVALIDKVSELEAKIEEAKKEEEPENPEDPKEEEGEVEGEEETRTTTEPTLEELQEQLDSARKSYSDFQSENIKYELTFTNAKSTELTVPVANFTDLVTNPIELVFDDVEEPEEDPLYALNVYLMDVSWTLGEHIDFAEQLVIDFYEIESDFLVETPTLAEVKVLNEKGEAVTGTTIPTVFHQFMGETFTVEYVYQGKTYTSEFDTHVFAGPQNQVSFDSLNVEVNFGATTTIEAGSTSFQVQPDQEYISQVATFKDENAQVSTYNNYDGTFTSYASQEFTFKAPGTYDIPLIHIADDEYVDTVGYVRVNVTAETNSKLDISYTGKDNNFDASKLVFTTEKGTELNIADEGVYVYNDKLVQIDENYVIAKGTEEVLHVSVIDTTDRALINPNVHYGGATIVVDADGNVVDPVNPVTPTTPEAKTPNTGITNNTAYYVAIAGLAVFALVLVKKSKKVNY